MEKYGNKDNYISDFDLFPSFTGRVSWLFKHWKHYTFRIFMIFGSRTRNVPCNMLCYTVLTPFRNQDCFLEFANFAEFLYLNNRTIVHLGKI